MYKRNRRYPNHLLVYENGIIVIRQLFCENKRKLINIFKISQSAPNFDTS